ncbi:MAG TPA: P63C domain-containing protein [Candidatus Angelobacter sp.]|nr:P63C domain-containing protein [Candidatus Angelobacter sp.]
MSNEIKQVSSLGGKARAKSLSANERSAIAKAAAEARWGDVPSLLPKETHQGILKIGPLELICGVLDNGTRVFSARGVTRAMGGKQTGKASNSVDGALPFPSFLAADNIKGFIDNDLMARLISPIHYRPKHGGRSAFGYEATLLGDICNVILDANDSAPLRINQRHLVATAKTLSRGFQKVGIVALVDEATGYQDERPKDELSKILEAYIAPELMPWTRMFPAEFFKQIYRIQGWSYQEGSAKRTPYVGKLINKYIYEPLPPGVLDELRRRNPVTESGYRKYKHPQFLTPDTGIPHLDKQITTVTTLLRISDDKQEFERNFRKAFGGPIQDRLPLKAATEDQ